MQTGAALGGAAVILFERHEQKDKSGSADPKGNALIYKNKNLKLFDDGNCIIVGNHLVIN